jgi:CheY-like chemotaxis protein/HPt (histidine-containing phosphotransfer) domain-containing protein
LVDDNTVNQKVGTRLLQRLGFTADLAGHGQEAVDAFTKAPYDVVLMDVQMPVMDGLEATRRIRGHERALGAARPAPAFIVAMTASAMVGDRERCLESGMDEYITKPVRSEELTQALERYIATRQQQAQAAVAATPPAEAPAPAAPPTDPAATEPPVDMERLNDFSSGDEGAMLELAQMYLSQAAGHLESLSQAVQRQAAEEVKRVAHTLAGSSATCGMVAVVPPLRALEKMGYEQNLAEASARLAEVLREFGRVRDFLAQRLPGLRV